MTLLKPFKSISDLIKEGSRKNKRKTKELQPGDFKLSDHFFEREKNRFLFGLR